MPPRDKKRSEAANASQVGRDMMTVGFWRDAYVALAASSCILVPGVPALVSFGDPWQTPFVLGKDYTSYRWTRDSLNCEDP